MNILILGATSFLGQKLVPMLSDIAENQVFCVSRSKKSASKNITWIKHDLQKDAWGFSRSFFDVVVFCADTHLVKYVDKKIKTDFFLLISSASRIVKQHSVNQDDKNLVKALSRDESYVRENYKQSFILRPSWIYCGPDDKISNVILDFVKKFRILPLTLAAKGKRNPISANNLAQVICWCLKNQKIALREKHLNVGGAWTLHYDQLVKNLISEHDIFYFTIRLPTWFYSFAITVLHRFNIKKEVKIYMFQHMDTDLNACIADALRLGIDLRAFNEEE